MYVIMSQQVKAKYNKFNHNFYVLWDFIKSTFVKVKKNPILTIRFSFDHCLK